MLPPPTTTATSTPSACTRSTCLAMALMRSGSAPYSRSPISASPESFRRMRSNADDALLLAELVPGEPADHDVLPRLRRRGRAQVLDRLTAVLALVHVLLVQQHDLLQPLAQPALGDLRPHVLGLVGGLLLEDPPPPPPVLGGDVLLRHVERRGLGDVQGDVARELLEV